MRFTYECCDCGKTFESEEVLYQCPDCSRLNDGSTFPKGNLIVRLNKDDLQALAKKDHVDMYDFFPYTIPTPQVYPVGGTPLATPARLCKKYGIKNLTCKLDSALPSGSFKDRASQLIAAQAIAHGENRIALASTGNAGAAMSCAGAAYGLDIILFVPATAPINKLMQSVLYGATVVPVKGTYDDAFALSIAYTERFGGINRNTAYNPMTIEGKKSISIELFEQMGRKVPDVVYVPVGDGCIYAGVFKGFQDLLEAGIIEKLPHIVCVQSKQSNAISQAWKTGEFKCLENATTRADSISVESPANGRMAVRYIKECKGWATEVEDTEIFEAQLELTREAGIFVEPAAACAWAGVVKDSKMLLEKFGKEVSVCTLLTGTGFKDMAAFAGRVSIPEAIENSKEAVIKYFEK
ncbi:pyridoxal-phosphate dependent enzyme [uncultured Sphaerochaeta sp.]|uniref:threonine synthase n=1 Tax=uncultured Sphaerochaeta sp. TaxID=886478 RepID=UPI002A0A863E|nr:pyridoxal-phosphate dependent enzyme [uncultured Sphaerochaeta sp.]